MPLGRKIRYGMVGGGPDAFIGAVHRKAAALDGEIDLVAGAFSASPEKSQQQGAELLLDSNRVYDSYQEMAEKESALPEGERIDFVSIVTPNHVHFDVAKTFIEAGFHVVCDKPMTTTLEDAEALCGLVKQHDAVFALTHNYTGYPMVKQARELVSQGTLGSVRKIVVEYPQGWLATFLEGEGAKQAVWRTDPSQAGVSSCIGDIGSHAENLAHYITGLELEEICADLTTFVDGRQLEDDGNILVHYKGGARECCMPRKFLLAKKTIFVSASTARRLRSNGIKRIRIISMSVFQMVLSMCISAVTTMLLRLQRTTHDCPLDTQKRS